MARQVWSWQVKCNPGSSCSICDCPGYRRFLRAATTQEHCIDCGHSGHRHDGQSGVMVGCARTVLSLGAATFVTKPFELDGLMAEIRALTAHSEETKDDVHSGAGR